MGFSDKQALSDVLVAEEGGDVEKRAAVTFQVRAHAVIDQLPRYVGIAGVYGGHEWASQPCGVVIYFFYSPRLRAERRRPRGPR